MLNPIWLNTFKTLVEVGHFTQTAEALHMTQPGVSQHIHKLESACGHLLIKREGKRFELTEQGRLMYDYALKVTKDEATLLERLSFDDPFSGVCKLSCSGALALLLYTPLLVLQQQHPNLIIQLEVAPNHKTLQDLQTGAVDLGIVTHQPNETQYQSSVIGSETLCLVLPSAYQDAVIQPELLHQVGLINHPDAKHYLPLYLERCGDPALAELDTERLAVTGYINQLSQILLPVAKGLGFTVLPEAAVASFAHQESLHVVVPKQPVEETLYLVHKRYRTLPKRYDTIFKALAEILSPG